VNQQVIVKDHETQVSWSKFARSFKEGSLIQPGIQINQGVTHPTDLDNRTKKSHQCAALHYTQKTQPRRPSMALAQVQRTEDPERHEIVIFPSHNESCSTTIRHFRRAI